MKVGLSANQALRGKEFAIKRKRSSAHQIIPVSKQAKPEMKVADATRQIGVSKQTFRRLPLSANSVILDSPAVSRRVNKEIEVYQVAGQYMCIGETSNRLWPYDAHTSQRPFLNWLPDGLAYRYAQFSLIPSLRSWFREISEESTSSFRREGRGVSYHELNLAIGDSYRIVSDRPALLATRDPLKMLKRALARDSSREPMLYNYAPRRYRALFRQSLNLLIRKE
jgi:hypothetical protein